MRLDRRQMLLVFAGLLAACAAPPAPAAKKPLPPPVVDEGQLRTARYTIHYEPGLQKDANRFRAVLDRALASLRDEFGPFRPLDLMRGTIFDIYLESKRPVDLVSLEYAAKGGQYVAKLRLLSPSLVPSEARTPTGEPLDDAYYSKIAVQKCAAIFLDLLLRAKSAGWTFNSAPSWFVQGYQEYLGLVRSSEQNRQVTLPKVQQMVRDNPDRIRPDLTVTDVRIDGAMLVLFMHERFGIDRVQAILLRPEVEFPEALTRELGLSSMSDFYRKWREWLSGKAGPAARAP